MSFTIYLFVETSIWILALKSKDGCNILFKVHDGNTIIILTIVYIVWVITFQTNQFIILSVGLYVELNCINEALKAWKFHKISDWENSEIYFLQEIYHVLWKHSESNFRTCAMAEKMTVNKNVHCGKCLLLRLE